MTEAGPASVRTLLTGNRAFGSLWLARLLSFAGDSAGLIALLLYTAGRFGSGLGVALLMIAADFVPGLVGPLAGLAGDRFGKRAVLVACELAQGAIITLIALTLPALPLLLIAVAAQAILAAVFQAAARAAVPGLVASADLERANAAIGLGSNGLDSVGPLLGAVLLTVLSVRGLLLVDAVSFVLSAALLLRLPALAPSPGLAGDDSGAALPRRLLADAGAGLRAVWSSRPLRVLTLSFTVVVLFTGVDDVALVFLARHTLHGSSAAASLVYAGAGLGLLAGFLLLTRVAPRIALPLLIVGGYAIASAGNLLTGLAFAIVAALGFQIIRGLGIAAMDVGHTTLLQRIVPAEMLGRAFGTVYGAIGVAAGLSYVAGGLLLDATNPRITLIVAGGGGLAAAAVAAVALPRALRPAE